MSKHIHKASEKQDASLPDAAQVEVSWFDSVKDGSVSEKTVTIAHLCKQIKSHKSPYYDKVRRARAALSEGDTAGYDKLKGTLPAVTVSGTFQRRVAKLIQRYTQLVILDIDKLSKSGLLVQEVRERAERIPTTCVCFVSPSGDGLKIIVRVAGQLHHHAYVVKSLMNYYKKGLEADVDVTGKDVSRLCFLSHDPNLYSNFNSIIFSPNMDISARIASARSIVNKRLTLPGCGRNNYVYSFSCIANKYGIEKGKIEEYCCEEFSEEDFSEDEIIKAVRSAYHNNHEFGTWSHLEPSIAGTQGRFSEQELASARKALLIDGLQGDVALVVEILVKSLMGISQSENNLVDTLAQTLGVHKRYLSKIGHEHVLTEIIAHAGGGIDEVIGPRKPNGNFCRIIEAAIEGNSSDEIPPTGKQVLIWEFASLIVKRGFERELSLAMHIPKEKLSKHISLLKQLEESYAIIQGNACFAYEMTIDEKVLTEDKGAVGV